MEPNPVRRVGEIARWRIVKKKTICVLSFTLESFTNPSISSCSKVPMRSKRLKTLACIANNTSSHYTRHVST